MFIRVHILAYYLAFVKNKPNLLPSNRHFQGARPSSKPPPTPSSTSVFRANSGNDFVSELISQETTLKLRRAEWTKRLGYNNPCA